MNEFDAKDIKEFGIEPDDQFKSEDIKEFGIEPDRITQYVQNIKPQEFSPLESFIGGGAESASFGFLDELTGLAGGAGEYLGQELGAFDVEGLETPKQSPVDIYKRYRDIQRQRLEQMREENPKAMLSGELAGGFAVPGGILAKGAGKGSSLARKIIQSSKGGVGLGAVTGAGISEAETPMGIAKDIGTSAILGGTIGGGLPIIGAGAKQIGKIPGAIGKSDIGQIFKSYLKGDKLAEEIPENLQKLKNLGGEVSSEIAKRSKDEGTIFGEIINKATEAGNVAEVTPILKQAKDRLLKLTKDPDEKTAKSAKQLIGVIDNIIEGKEVTKLVPKVSLQEQELMKQQDILKAYNKLAQKRIKKGLSDPEEIAFNRLAEKKAEAEARAVQPLEFDESDIYTSDEGKKVFRQRQALDPEKQELVDAVQSGDAPHLEGLLDSEISSGRKTITQVIDDSNLTPIEFKVDEDTGLEYLMYRNESTGKVEASFVPKREELFSKLKPVKTREGGKQALTPQELQETKSAFRGYTPLESPDLPNRIGSEALNIVSELNKLLPSEAQTQSQKISELKSLFKQLTGKETTDILNQSQKGSVREKLGDLLLETSPEIKHKTRLKDILEGFNDPTRIEKNVKGLREVAPDLAQRIENEAPDIAEKIRLGLSIDPEELKTISPDLKSQVLSQFGGGFGLARKAAAGSGTATKSIVDFTKDISKSLSTASPDVINNIVSKVTKSGGTVAQNLARNLAKLEQADKRTRQAILFSIMQNPLYREKLKEIQMDVGVTDESGQ